MLIEQFQQLLRTCEGMHDIVCSVKKLDGGLLLPGAPKVMVHGPVFFEGKAHIFEIEIDAEDIEEVTPALVLEFATHVRSAIAQAARQIKDGSVTYDFDMQMPSSFPDKLGAR